ncbi:MAG: SLBB domain-containing protein [Candidatus Izemoplasmatales bacterium]|jgi:competence protein ComEA|nr:SLBB domain-containing protein [Candidatus Izemoplasmatales bacterium]
MKKYIAYGMVLIGIIGFFYFNRSPETQEVYEIKKVEQTEIITEETEKYFAEIRGEVRFPGVYQIEENTILKTLIDKAGGLTENADISGINQAQVVIKNSLTIIPKMTDSFVEENVSDSIYVDIKGEVNNPGVYLVNSNLRVFEIIEIAGGLTEKADIDNINMSQLVYDGILIEIPSIPESVKITAYIYGAVISPGYYTLDEGSLLGELISLAGGLKETADLTKINQSTIVNNGDSFEILEIIETNKIYVSIKGEVVNPDVYYVDENITVLEMITLAGGLTELADSEAINFNQTLILGSVINIPAIVIDDYQPIYNDGELININTASLDVLTRLNGIGEILAQRIIDYRIANGYFTSKEEIMNVSGIKETIYEQIKDDITV